MVGGVGEGESGEEVGWVAIVFAKVFLSFVSDTIGVYAGITLLLKLNLISAENIMPCIV